MFKRRYLIIILIVLMVVLGCSKGNKVHSKDYFYMDTYINVKIYGNDKKIINEAFKEIDKIYQQYHRLTDRYNEYDGIINVYYLNHHLKNNEFITIDEELYDILKYGKDFYHQSNGLVSIAIGNVVDVWKNYRENNLGVPSYEELKNSGSINIDDIILGDNNQYMKKNDVSIDLGSIAKGYTTEIVGDYLESKGLDKYLINAGGNVKVGNHYDNDRYKIGIENPTNINDIIKIVRGNNFSLVTSGSYQRFYEYEGKIYHHIIDPNTLFPPEHMLSVSIITEDNALADALSTMLFLMPIEDGMKYINSLNNVEAVWYGKDNKIYYSEGFKKYE